VQYLKKKPDDKTDKPGAEGKLEAEGKAPESKATENKPAAKDPNAAPSPPRRHPPRSKGRTTILRPGGSLWPGGPSLRLLQGEDFDLYACPQNRFLYLF
jgi:hypothetical protein